MNNKCCPLLLMAGHIKTGCRGDSCAWWDDDVNRCSVLSLLSSVEAVGDMVSGTCDALTDVTRIIAEKM